MRYFSNFAKLLLFSIVLLVFSCDTSKKHLEEAKSKDTISAYEEFLQKHPNSKYSIEAKNRLNQLYTKKDWELAKSTNTVLAYEKFINEYPDSKYVEEAKTTIEKLKLLEQTTWKDTKNKNNMLSYYEFIKKYPNSKYDEEAQKRIFELVMKFHSEKDLKLSISKFPDETQRDSIYSDLADICLTKVEKLNTDDSYIKFLIIFYSSKHAERVESLIKNYIYLRGKTLLPWSKIKYYTTKYAKEDFPHGFFIEAFSDESIIPIGITMRYAGGMYFFKEGVTFTSEKWSEFCDFKFRGKLVISKRGFVLMDGGEIIKRKVQS